MNTIPTSPRLQALLGEMEGNTPNALKAFWGEIEAKGTPLFEPIEGDDIYCHATFLWRDMGDTENVIVTTDFVPRQISQMTHLEKTDIWYQTERMRRDVRLTYRLGCNDPLTPATGLDRTAFRARINHWQADPLNRKVLHVPLDEEGVNRVTDIEFAILEAPYAAAEPHVSLHSDVPKGQVSLHRFASQILGNERRVYVYLPPGYTMQSDPYHLLITTDGWAYVKVIQAPTILDNLHAESVVSPMVAVFVDNAPEGRRDIELDAYAPFNRFLREELLPWVRQQYHVTIDPNDCVIAGFSRGGTTAAYAAFELSDIFGRVLSQSGWFGNIKIDDPEPGWIIRQFVKQNPLPLRFYLNAGLMENHPEADGSSLLSMNRHVRDVLLAKGYPLEYVEFSGGHDYLWWRQTLADGLISLLKN